MFQALMIANRLRACQTASFLVPKKCFQTSNPRPIPPILFTLIKPMSRILGLVLGKRFRKWWQGLPEAERQMLKSHASQNYKMIGVGSIALALALTYLSYDTHLEESELTGRKRFLALRKDQVQKIAKEEFEGLLEDFDSLILDESHPYYDRVARVASRILRSNSDIEDVKEKQWTITVIDFDEQNAFVLPSGNIFVFTGMLNVCTDDDQLGMVLSHEIAHTLLNHAGEMLSYINLMDALLILPMAMLWAVIPSDGIAFITNWFFHKVSQVMIDLPFSRQMETEADEVGLKLAAKACFDVREAPVFWAKMQVVSLLSDHVEPPEYLSTHPSHESRQDHLLTLVPEALKLRTECGCQKLRRKDPIAELEKFKKAMEKEAAIRQQTQTANMNKKRRVVTYEVA